MRQRSFLRGGKRKGAGRPPGPRPWVSRVPRAAVSRHTPLHITMRARPGIDLRSFPLHASLREAMHLGRERFGFRLVHYSIQKDHLHLISEANDRRALSRGMQGLGIRMAKGVNRQLGVRGKVFADRYHVRALRTPREVRRALAYVLHNRRRHLAKRGRGPKHWRLDPLSSAAFFDGWREPVAPHADELEAPPVVPATVWLLTIGWRRHGPISIDELPAPP